MSSGKLRILVIGPVISPHLHDRAQCFVRLGHKVCLITNTEDYSIPGVKNLIVRGVPLGTFFRGIAISRLLSFYSEVDRFKPDVIMVHYAGGLWNWLAATCKVPLIVCVMGGDVLFEQTNPSKLEQKLTAGLLERADWVLTESGYLADRVKKIGRKRDLSVFTWGVNSRFFGIAGKKDFKKQYHVKKNEKIILSPRGMLPLYNIDIIVKGFALVCRELDARLFLSSVYTDELYKAQIEGLIKESGIEDKVVILPKLEDHEIPALYHEADIAISMSSSDGMPRSFFEASARRTPMIMSDLKNYQDVIVHNYNAYCVNINALDLGHALKKMLNSHDLNRRISGNAVLTLEKMQSRYQQKLIFLDSVCCRFSRTARIIPVAKRAACFFRLLMLLFFKQTIVSRTNQPVFASVSLYIKSLIGKK